MALSACTEAVARVIRASMVRMSHVDVQEALRRTVAKVLVCTLMLSTAPIDVPAITISRRILPRWPSSFRNSQPQVAPQEMAPELGAHRRGSGVAPRAANALVTS